MNPIRRIRRVVSRSKYLLHETKRSVLTKFLLLFSAFVAYFVFVAFYYGLENGFAVTLLTWSFFVFCSPVTSAGFLLDFPIRMITNIRMFYSEIGAWCAAFVINSYFITSNPAIYDKVSLLVLFRYILTHPLPMWGIILISAVGTFTSVYFGDEMIDVARHVQRKKYEKHKNKYKLVLMLFIVAVAAILYTYLLGSLNLDVPF